MNRLPLVEPGADGTYPNQIAAVFERFDAEGRAPIALYRALANAPRILRTYSILASSLRTDSTTPAPLRELVILRTVSLCRSAYLWSHHVPIALSAGVSPAQVHGLLTWPDCADFTDQQRVALQCADKLHAAEVDDATYAALAANFPSHQVVELVMLASFYEAVARVVQALGVQVEPEYEQYLASAWQPWQA